ncbi:MAG: mreC [Frankiales bacterium]|nr:mreC [Frankiales bacterium]
MRGSGRLRLLLVLLVLTAFTLTALDYRSAGGGSPFDAVRRGSDTLFGPAQRAVGGVVNSVGSALGGLPRLGGYKDDNAKLRAENDRLVAQLHETDGLRRQLDESQTLLRLKDTGTYTIVPARVTAVGSSLGFEWTATIDVGSKAGITVNKTVVNGKGLVGRVKRVGPYSSVVVLVVDPDFSVGMRLLRSGQLGIATGRGLGPLGYQLLGQNSRAAVGDPVYTSGSMTFEPGVPVGRVSSTNADPNALTPTGSLQPYVDVTSLDLVGVIVRPATGTPRVPIPPTVAPVPSQTAGPSATPSPGAPLATATPTATPAP